MRADDGGRNVLMWGGDDGGRNVLMWGGGRWTTQLKGGGGNIKSILKSMYPSKIEFVK
jgi:hypothetical protein